MRCWPNHQQVSAIYHSNFISRPLHILNASLNHIGKLSTLQHIINLITIWLTLTPTSFLKETWFFFLVHYGICEISGFMCCIWGSQFIVTQWRRMVSNIFANTGSGNSIKPSSSPISIHDNSPVNSGIMFAMISKISINKFEIYTFEATATSSRRQCVKHLRARGRYLLHK